MNAMRAKTWRQFLARHSEIGMLRAFLAARELAPVLRDPAPGRVPHGWRDEEHMSLYPIFLKLEGHKVLIVVRLDRRTKN